MRWIVERWRRRNAPVIPTVRLSGVIGGRSLGGAAMSAKSVAPMIEQAFSFKKAPAVALVINSPGGSPAQTSLIARQIRRLAEKENKKVIAFIEDVAASGGYWLACAADEIHADSSSILGSIGVISAGFGFVEAIKKIGVERRLHTAGDRKAMLDPFSAQDRMDVEYLKSIQSEIHESFKGWVRDRRGDKIGDEADLFDGRVLVGRHAVTAGLCDAIGHIDDKLREKYGEDVKIRYIAPAKALLPWRAAGAGTMIDQLVADIDAQAAWRRYGL